MPHELPSNLAVVKFVLLGLAGTGVLFNLASSVVNSSSPQSCFSMLNSYQLILLLPLLAASMPNDVIAFIVGLKFSLINFSVWDPQQLIGVRDDIESLDFEQSVPYLTLVDLESGSSAVNSVGLLGSFAFVPLVHIAYLPLYLCLAKR